MRFLEGATVLAIDFLYVIGPVIILAAIVELVVKTRLGHRFERWLFKKFGIEDYED